MRRQSGMSLLEVMVAMLIGMIGVLIITQAYITSDNFNRSTVGEGGAQTNGLIALYSMERDIKGGGYGIADSTVLGCGEAYWYHGGNHSKNITPTSPLERIFVAPVHIQTDTTVPLTDPDRITVMASSESERMVAGQIRGFASTTNIVDTDSKVGFAVNDRVLLVGSTGCTLAKITFVEPDPSQKLQLNPEASNPPSWGLYPTSYAVGDSIVNMGPNPVIRTYSINNGKLRVTDPIALAAGTAGAQTDVMDGIVDLRAQYGKDNGAGGNVPNDYKVDEFSSVTPANSSEWQQVMSVRIAVLARIGTYEKPNSAGECSATVNPPTWSGGVFTAIDVATVTSADRCYRYRVFETTVPLRNMIWRAS